LPDGGYAVVRVLKAAPAAPDAAQEAQAKGAVQGAYQEAEALAVYDSLKARYKVKTQDDRIAKFSSQPASAAN
jgi:hypothetical protein